LTKLTYICVHVCLFRLYGLGSVLHIKCDNSMCLATTDVHTRKRTPNGSYCINSKVAIGMKILKEVFIVKL